ncbi:MAG TPA: hypothetical protein VMM59_12630 [Thermohalobaculum sp.]|nr:hypothetical protein [Thermohalobaculum sp.]
MTTDALAPGHAARPGRSLPHWVGTMAESFRWAVEMQRRCERELAMGRPLDDASIRRLVGEVNAWAARR